MNNSIVDHMSFISGTGSFRNKKASATITKRSRDEFEMDRDKT